MTYRLQRTLGIVVIIAIIALVIGVVGGVFEVCSTSAHEGEEHGSKDCEPWLRHLLDF